LTSLAPPTISACIIARDEAKHLRELLPNLRWADELVVVVDDRTIDDSAAVATSLADRVAVRGFDTFAQFRNAALACCTGSWVLFVDADERVSEALREEVRSTVKASEMLRSSQPASAPVGYWIPRQNLICGRLVKGGGWSPDYQLRLLRRAQARYDGHRPVHELVVLDGPEGYLTERLLHFNYQTLRQFLSKQRVYTQLEAKGLRAQGVTFRARSLVGQPLREFFRRYVQLGGWGDGWLGLFLSGSLAYYAFRRVQLARRGLGPASPLTPSDAADRRAS
jgi:glycosyltransferase involved in cell wall biosynthesis